MEEYVENTKSVRKKKYHFVKVNTVGNDPSMATWYLKPESKSDIIDHWERYCVSEISEGVREYVDALKAHANGQYFGHYTSLWAGILDNFEKMTGFGGALRSMKMEVELFCNRMKYFEDGLDIYLAEGCTVFMLTEGYTEIIDHYYSDELFFPSEEILLENVRYAEDIGTPR